MSTVKLRWVNKEPERESPAVSRDVVDSVTVIVAASRLIEARWHDLSDAQRQDLTTMLRRRADGLLAALSEQVL